MKLNDKGMTLIELIISFAILALLVFSMLGTVISVKKKASDEAFSKEMAEFKSTLVKDIEDDLIKNTVNNVTCSDHTCTITYDDSTTTTITVSSTDKTITFNNIIYDIPNKDQISLGVINMGVTTIDGTRSLLTIDVPYYEISTSTPNYGFKISHPFVVTTTP